jgi:hypothetical protein
MSGDFPVIDIAAVRRPQVSAAARFEIAALPVCARC